MARPFSTRGWPLGEHGRSGSPASGTRRHPNVREGPHTFLQSLGTARPPHPEGAGSALLGTPFCRDSSWGAAPEDTGTLDPKAEPLGAGESQWEPRPPLSAGPCGRFPSLLGGWGASSPRQGHPLPPVLAMGVPGRAPLPPALPPGCHGNPPPGSGPEPRRERPEPPPPGQPPAPHWSSGNRCGAPGSLRPSPGPAESGVRRRRCRSSRRPWQRGNPGAPSAVTPRPARRAAGKVRQGRGARSQHPHPALPPPAADLGLGRVSRPRRDPRGPGRRTPGARRTASGSGSGSEKARGSWGRPPRPIGGEGVRREAACARARGPSPRGAHGDVRAWPRVPVCAAPASESRRT